MKLPKSIDTQKLLDQAGKVPGWLEPMRLRMQPFLERWLRDWRAEKARPEADFVADADFYMIHQ